MYFILLSSYYNFIFHRVHHLFCYFRNCSDERKKTFTSEKSWIVQRNRAVCCDRNERNLFSFMKRIKEKAKCPCDEATDGGNGFGRITGRPGRVMMMIPSSGGSSSCHEQVTRGGIAARVHTAWPARSKKGDAVLWTYQSFGSSPATGPSRNYIQPVIITSD